MFLDDRIKTFKQKTIEYKILTLVCLHLGTDRDYVQALSRLA